MQKQIASLSVFFPAYNEEGNLENTVKKAVTVLENVAEKWEIIIVDDGSKDRTPHIADDLAKQHKNIRAIHHNPNRGYGGAFKTGFTQSKYPWISFTDSDGQFDFSEITNFLQTQRETNADAVIGFYKKRQVSKFKIITSKMWEYLVFFMFGLKVHDIDCGFKLVSKETVDAVFPLESERGAFISSEFLIKAKAKGFKIVEIGVTHYPRTTGQGTGRDLQVIFKSFQDLLKLWVKLNFR